jgi:hypothetical protein
VLYPIAGGMSGLLLHDAAEILGRKAKEAGMSVTSKTDTPSLTILSLSNNSMFCVFSIDYQFFWLQKYTIILIKRTSFRLIDKQSFPTDNACIF